MDAKYIKTKDGSIIIFSAAINHSEFKKFNPVSAGMISFNSVDSLVVCSCYGESHSLGLSAEEKDSALAQTQIARFLI